MSERKPDRSGLVRGRVPERLDSYFSGIFHGSMPFVYMDAFFGHYYLLPELVIEVSQYACMVLPLVLTLALGRKVDAIMADGSKRSRFVVEREIPPRLRSYIAEMWPPSVAVLACGWW